MSKPQDLDRKELFENTPVPKALATFAVPTVISQLIAMVYNLADTYFIGRTNDPYMVSAVTLCFTLFASFNAFGQLFGIGGGALTSKLLGEYKEDEAKKIGCYSFYCSILVSLLLSILAFVFEEQLLRFLGASNDNIGYASQYLTYTLILGGIPTITSIAFSHLLRNEGFSKESSFGLSMGGVLNIILDPLFMFVIYEPGNEVKGAAVATMISNYIVLIYFLAFYYKHRKQTIMNLNLKNFAKGVPYTGKILSIGFPSFIAPFAATLANGTLNRLCAGHGDIAVAGFGIAKKIDMLPMNTALGLCQGMVALVSYNYANKNFKRMKAFIDTTRWIGVGVAVCCIILFELFPYQIVGLFIEDAATVELGVMAIRRMVLSTPLMISIFHMTYAYQSMGFGFKSLVIALARQAFVNVPMMFLMDRLLGLEGLFWNQLLADSIVVIIAFTFYHYDMKKIQRSLEQG